MCNSCDVEIFIYKIYTYIHNNKRLGNSKYYTTLTVQLGKSSTRPQQSQSNNEASQTQQFTFSALLRQSVSVFSTTVNLNTGSLTRTRNATYVLY